MIYQPTCLCVASIMCSKNLLCALWIRVTNFGRSVAPVCFAALCAHPLLVPVVRQVFIEADMEAEGGAAAATAAAVA